MQLRDLKHRAYSKVRTVDKNCSCWECVNQMLPDNQQDKKRVVFRDKSQVILCLDHFVKLEEMNKR